MSLDDVAREYGEVLAIVNAAIDDGLRAEGILARLAQRGYLWARAEDLDELDRLRAESRRP